MEIIEIILSKEKGASLDMLFAKCSQIMYI